MTKLEFELIFMNLFDRYMDLSYNPLVSIYHQHVRKAPLHKVYCNVMAKTVLCNRAFSSHHNQLHARIPVLARSMH